MEFKLEILEISSSYDTTAKNNNFYYFFFRMGGGWMSEGQDISAQEHKEDSRRIEKWTVGLWTEEVVQEPRLDVKYYQSTVHNFVVRQMRISHCAAEIDTIGSKGC